MTEVDRQVQSPMEWGRALYHVHADGMRANSNTVHIERFLLHLRYIFDGGEAHGENDSEVTWWRKAGRSFGSGLSGDELPAGSGTGGIGGNFCRQPTLPGIAARSAGLFRDGDEPVRHGGLRRSVALRC